MLAFAWMALSGLGFSIMSVFVKRLAPVIPQFELVFFRAFVNFLIVFALMAGRREDFFPRGKPLLVFRGLAGFGGVSCLFYSVAHLPLSVAAMLNWCSPLFVLLISRLALKESVHPRAFKWVAVAFAGLIILLSPDQSPSVPGLPHLAVGVGILGAAFAGLAYVAVRAATARVSVNAIVLYFTGVASLLSAPLAFRDFRVPGTRELIELICVGVFASIGQIAMTQGYRHALAGLVSTMSLMNAGFAAIFGWMVFNELLVPHQWMGMALLAMGVGLVTLSGGRPLPKLP